MPCTFKILLVDDDADDCEVFVKSVHEIDSEIICHTACDGEMALGFLNNRANELPDLIFLDLSMPRLGGKLCLSRIKADEYLKHIPVIIYTSSDDVQAAIELQQMGASHFITKPGNPDEIYYLVSLMLDEFRSIS